MTTPIALLLIIVFLGGAGLFVRAYRQGMRFGERMEEKKNTGKDSQKNRSDADPTDAP